MKKKPVTSYASDLSKGMKQVWGIRPEPIKGPKAALDVERIVRTAIEIAANEGVGAVSMARVAGQLEASPMALYRHVESKDELVHLMIDFALGTTPPPAPSDDDWRSEVTTWARWYYAALMANSWALAIPITGMPETPNKLRVLETGLRALRTTSLSSSDRMSSVLLLSGFVWNHAALMVGLIAGVQAKGKQMDELLRVAGATYRELTTPEEFPNLHVIIDDGFFEDDETAPAEGVDEEFEFGLERLLDGLAVFMQKAPR